LAILIRSSAVSLEETFWWVMGRKVQECNTPPVKIEVLNFGVSGYRYCSGTADAPRAGLEVFSRHRDAGVTTNNDITDNSRALKKTEGIPYFVYHDNHLTLDDSFRNSRAFRLRQSGISRFGRWLRDHSRVVQAITQGIMASEFSWHHGGRGDLKR